MITPVFNLEQNGKFLIVKILAPFSKLSDCEISFGGTEFVFTSKPYFLRLHLPKNVKIDEEGGCASYDSDTRTFTVNVPKETEGEFFPGLDMITKLLIPQGDVKVKKIVEEVDSDEDAETSKDQEELFYEQNASEKSDFQFLGLDSSLEFGYGFGQRYLGVFGKLREEIWTLIDLEHPEKSPMEERIKICWDQTGEKFDPDYYLADFYDPDPTMSECLKFKPFWNQNPEKIEFTELERRRLKDLPRRGNPGNCLKNPECVLNSLIDILFAYVYDLRTTEGEHNVESGWTISKLAPTLSHLISWRDPKTSLISCMRKSLAYPLYRNWQLSEKVLQDLKQLIGKGKTAIIKALLDIHEVFATSGEYRYLFNDLYITDYLLWMQYCSDSTIESHSKILNKIEITKSDLDLDLDELELEAQMLNLEIANEKS